MRSRKICAVLLAAALSVSAVSATTCLKVTTLEAAAEEGGAQSAPYTITMESDKITISADEVTEGETVTVTAKHGENFKANIVVETVDDVDAIDVEPDADNPSVSFPPDNMPPMEKTSTFTFTMPGKAVTVKGEFTQYYNITKGPNDANGTITIDKNAAAYEDELTITVSPNTGYELYKLTAKGQRPDGTNDQEWTATDVVNGKITTTMPRDNMTFTAEFIKEGHFHISSSAMIGDKEQSPWSRLNVDDTVGKGSSAAGETVTLTVSDRYLRLKSLKVTNKSDQTSIPLTSVSGIDFPINFGENDTEEFTFTMPAADVLIEAEAAQIQPIVTSDTTNGTIGLDKKFAEIGESVTVTVTPDAGYELDQITVTRTLGQNSTPVTISEAYTFVVDATGKYTVAATFKQAGALHISSSAVINGTTQSPWKMLTVGETANVGERVELTVTDRYLRLKSLKVTNKSDQTSIPLTSVSGIDFPINFGENDTEKFTFTMPAADVLIEAEAVSIQPIVTSDTTNGTIGLDKKFAEIGESVTVTVAPDAGYELDQITVKRGSNSCDLVTVTEGTTYTFEVSGGPRYTVEATFKAIGGEGGGNTTTPTTPAEPVAPTTSGSTTSDSTNTTTSDTTSGAAAAVDPVDAKGDAAVKADGTTEVKVGDLGTVTVDAKDVAALEGAKVTIEATNEEKATSEALNTAVGTDASAETKSKVEAAVKAVKDGDAVTLDISFTKDNKTVEPGVTVSVTAPLPTSLKGAEMIFVYHIDDKGVVAVEFTYDKEKGTVTIKSDMFSPFIISKVEIKAAGEATSSTSSITSTTSTNPAGNPNTGVAALAVAPIVLAGTAAAIVSMKKRK